MPYPLYLYIIRTPTTISRSMWLCYVHVSDACVHTDVEYRIDIATRACNIGAIDSTPGSLHPDYHVDSKNKTVMNTGSEYFHMDQVELTYKGQVSQSPLTHTSTAPLYFDSSWRVNCASMTPCVWPVACVEDVEGRSLRRLVRVQRQNQDEDGDCVHKD